MTVELAELDHVSAKEAARKALAKIQDGTDDGILKADAVVDAARSPDHPLHRYFEWNDGAAAEQWRLSQARQLIRMVKVTMPDDGDREIPKYVSLRSDRKTPGGGYRATKEVLNNDQLLSELEQTMKKDIEGVLHRYEMLKDVCAKIRRAMGSKEKARKRAKVA